MIGIIQGVAELFPISSLGHTVIIPAFIGGSWSKLVTQQASSESPYLAFVVGLHVATALALIAYFWRDWLRIVKGFFSSLRNRRAETPDERAAWFIIVATIPVGILGFALEHQFRTLFAKPYAAADFLAVNGLILLGGEWLRRRAPGPARARARPGRGALRPLPAARPPEAAAPPVGEGDHDSEVLASLRLRDAVVVGFAQSTRAVRRHQPGRHLHGDRAVRGDSPTRTPPGSPSCCRRRRSWRPGYSRSPTSSATSATGSVARCSPAASPRS